MSPENAVGYRGAQSLDKGVIVQYFSRDSIRHIRAFPWRQAPSAAAVPKSWWPSPCAGGHPPSRSCAHLPQRIQKATPIPFRAKYGLRMIPAMDHMINRARVLNSWFPCHAPLTPYPASPRQKLSIYDPFAGVRIFREVHPAVGHASQQANNSF